MARVRMTSVETAKIKEDLKIFVLKQRAPFCVYSLTKDYLAHKGTMLTRKEHQRIRVYFSKTISDLLNLETPQIRLINIENMEDTLPKKIYVVIR